MSYGNSMNDLLLDVDDVLVDSPYQQQRVVCYDAPATLGRCLQRGWQLPTHVVDLLAEFRCWTSGLEIDDYSLTGALTYFGVADLAALWDMMRPSIDMPRAELRGRYTKVVAKMEARGVPIDMETLGRLRAGWGWIKDILIAETDVNYGVFDHGGQRFNPLLWKRWLNKNHIRWPRRDGKLKLDLGTFKEVSNRCPAVAPMHRLLSSLAAMGREGLHVDDDGRNRCPLRPFASKTGRNQPSTKAFIFGPAAWLRGLIKPPKGRAVAYIDWSSQEFAIAAALSEDSAMMEAYESGDPYLGFARLAGAVPAHATKKSHANEREQFKQCQLALNYGMGERGLALRLNVPISRARDLIAIHRRTFSRYWEWSDAVVKDAIRSGSMEAIFGWRLNVKPPVNRRSLKNFPVQANGGEMMRIACILLDKAGIEVCCPVHDAMLIEGPASDIKDIVQATQQGMRQASEVVLPGFPLRTDAKIVRHPDRYMDPRGRAMWDRVAGLLPTALAA
jgi:hypothetical protein